MDVNKLFLPEKRINLQLYDVRGVYEQGRADRAAAAGAWELARDACYTPFPVSVLISPTVKSSNQ
jgi:hypothetical protein